MKLGVVCALHTEACTLVHALEMVSQADSKEYQTAIANRSELKLIVSGMGSDRAEIAARSLVEEGVDFLISWGFAGGLDPVLGSGALIIPAALVTPEGQEHPASLHIDRPFLEAVATTVQVLDKPLVSVEKAVTTVEEKQMLFSKSGAVAVDMESAAIASVAQDTGINFAAVRAVLDGANRSLPRFIDQAVDEFGSVKIGSFIRSLARYPSDLFTLSSLMRGSGIAQRCLRQTASRLPAVVQTLEEQI